MSYIWLRYKDTTGDVQSRRFNATIERHFPTTKRDRGVTLRGYLFNHLLAAWRKHDVTISADELAKAAPRTFIETMWISPQAWISLDTSETEPDDSTFAELDLPDGDIPFDYIGGSKHLPEIAFTASIKEPL